MGSLLSSDTKSTAEGVISAPPGTGDRHEQLPFDSSTAAANLANSSSFIPTKTVNSVTDYNTTNVDLVGSLPSSPIQSISHLPALPPDQNKVPNDLIENLPSVISYNTSLMDYNNPNLTNSNVTTVTPTTTSSSLGEDEFSFTLFGTSVYPLQWLTLPNLYSWLSPLSSLAMIIGCVLPYVPQYMTIYRNRNCSGFSTFVCFTLLIANILRVAFWFGASFELPLLIQSVIMILAQLLLLELCVRVKRTNEKRNIFTSSVKFFWRWTDLASYLVFLCLFSALLGAAVYFYKDNDPFVQTIGYCALVTESMLALPQVIRNYRNSSVEGMSISMVLMWLAGDAFKTGYFIMNKVPFQFWLCGLTQITIDLIILIQVCVYSRASKTRTKTFSMESI